MDKTAICNAALIEAEVDSTITSFDNDSSIEAQRMRRIYDRTKKECLAAFNWSFATKYVYLSAVDSPDASVFTNTFKYPSGCLWVSGVFADIESAKNRNPALVYSVLSSDNERNRLICCDTEAPVASVTIDVLENNMPMLFAKYFYLTLALKFAKMAGADDSIKRRLYDEIALASSECMTFDTTVSNKLIYDEENEYIDVRV